MTNLTQEQNESPLEYFVTKAKELGIDESTLKDRLFDFVGFPSYIREKKLSTRLTGESSDTTWVALNEEELSENFQQNFIHLLAYVSKTNEAGITLLSGESIVSPIFYYRGSRKIRFSQQYSSPYFGIGGLTKTTETPKDDIIVDIGLATLGGRVLWSTSAKGLSFPKELFQNEREYAYGDQSCRPALDWMLQMYASGLAGTFSKSK